MNGTKKTWSQRLAAFAVLGAVLGGVVFATSSVRAHFPPAAATWLCSGNGYTCWRICPVPHDINACYIMCDYAPYEKRPISEKIWADPYSACVPEYVLHY